MFFFFFFQAEDGIRDYKVTGVQTCALPISVTFFSKEAKPTNVTVRRYSPGARLSIVKLPGASVTVETPFGCNSTRAPCKMQLLASTARPVTMPSLTWAGTGVVSNVHASANASSFSHTSRHLAPATAHLHHASRGPPIKAHRIHCRA